MIDAQNSLNAAQYASIGGMILAFLWIIATPLRLVRQNMVLWCKGSQAVLVLLLTIAGLLLLETYHAPIAFVIFGLIAIIEW